MSNMLRLSFMQFHLYAIPIVVLCSYRQAMGKKAMKYKASVEHNADLENELRLRKSMTWVCNSVSMATKHGRISHSEGQ